MPLSDLVCRTAKAADKPKKLSDEKGLYLLISNGGRYWRWDYRYVGKRKTMAFGVYPEVSLLDARNRRDAERRKLMEGFDPMANRKSEKLMKATASGNSFKLVALSWHATRSASWAAITAEKTKKHMECDLFPDLGSLPVSSISTPTLLAVLRKVESRGAAYTATRLREICGQIFRFAIATGFATYNPAADLKGALATPAVTHRPAITDPKELSDFLVALKQYRAADQLTLAATKIALLTFVRSQELRKAEWSEVNLAGAEWRIPAERMKTGKTLNQAHLVPLSPEAVNEFSRIRALGYGGNYIFPNNLGADSFMSENTIGRLLIRMGFQGKQTLHGFRATAMSLLSERGWSIEALERQLDHKEGNKVKAAYARSKHLSERKKMMLDWGALLAELEFPKQL